MNGTAFHKEVSSDPRVVLAEGNKTVSFMHKEHGHSIKCEWLGSVDYNGEKYVVVNHEHTPSKVSGDNGLGYTILKVIDHDGFKERYVQPTNAESSNVLSIFMRSAMLMR